MKEEELSLFIDKVVDYFEKVTGEPAKTGVPFLAKDKETILLELTGIITISGPRMGCVYVTASEPFYEEIGECMVPGMNLAAKDVAGELTNTIAGNARESLGADFIISVPIVVKGTDELVAIEVPIYHIPIEWRGHKAYLVIGLRG